MNIQLSSKKYFKGSKDYPEKNKRTYVGVLFVKQPKQVSRPDSVVVFKSLEKFKNQHSNPTVGNMNTPGGITTLHVITHVDDNQTQYVKTFIERIISNREPFTKPYDITELIRVLKEVNLELNSIHNQGWVSEKGVHTKTALRRGVFAQKYVNLETKNLAQKLMKKFDPTQQETLLRVEPEHINRFRRNLANLDGDWSIKSEPTTGVFIIVPSKNLFFSKPKPYSYGRKKKP